MRTFVGLAGLFVIVSLSAFDRFGSGGLTFKKAVIIKAEGPKFGKINRNLIFNIVLQGNNGCAKTARLQETAENKTRMIKGEVSYASGMCTQMLKEIKTTYTFKTTKRGTYYLKFLSEDNQYITDTLVIK